MMLEVKPHIRYYLVKLIISVILTVLVFVFREQLVENLKYFIGALMIAYGVEGIAFEIFNKHQAFYFESKTYLGLVELILGLTTLLVPLDYSYVCIIWATWSIIRESYELKELVTEIRSITWTIISGIESITVIVLSIMLIAEPTAHHAMIHIYLLLAELILNPLVPLLDETMEERKKKKNGSELN